MYKTIWASISLLTMRQRLAILILAVVTFGVNLLDILALTLLSAVGVIAIGGDLDFPVPFVDSFDSSNLVVVLLLVAGGLFASKTMLSLLLNRARLRFLASLEIFFSRKISSFIFGGSVGELKHYSRAYLDWSILRSTSIAFSGIVGQTLQLFTEVTLALLILALFFATDWISALLVLAYFGIVLVAFQLATNRKSSKTGKDVAAGNVTIGQAIGDTIVAFKEISVHNRVEFFLERIANSRAQVAYSQAFQNFISTLPRLIVEMALIIGAIGFAAFHFATSEGEPDLGLISIFVVGSLRMMSSLLPLQRAYMQLRFEAPLAEASQELVRAAARATAEKTDVPSTQPRIVAGSNYNNLSEAVSVKVSNVSFRFADRSDNANVLNDVSFSAPSGSSVAIIGPSGAGKSTLVDLILGLHDPTEGTILCSGLPPKSLRTAKPGIMSYVPQKPGLIAGTLRENIALGVHPESIDESALLKAIELSQVSNFIDGLPLGIDSDLGANSDSLSGGQIQRIGLARALYTKPRLLVLDEATSALDAETEASITDALYNLGSEVTSIIVAHRLSTIQKADVVYVMNEGQLIASGTLNELRRNVPLVEKYISLMSFDDE